MAQSLIVVLHEEKALLRGGVPRVAKVTRHVIVPQQRHQRQSFHQLLFLVGRGVAHSQRLDGDRQPVQRAAVHRRQRTRAEYLHTYRGENNQQ